MMEASPVTCLAKDLDGLTWSSRVQPSGSDATSSPGYSLEPPKWPILVREPNVEDSPSIACGILKEIGNKTERACCDDGSHSTGDSKFVFPEACTSLNKENAPQWLVGSHSGTRSQSSSQDSGFHSSTSNNGDTKQPFGTSSCHSLYGSKDETIFSLDAVDSTANTSATGGSWGHEQNPLTPAADSSVMDISDDGFLSSIQDCFQDSESKLPGDYDGLFNSPMYGSPLSASVSKKVQSLLVTPNTACGAGKSLSRRRLLLGAASNADTPSLLWSKGQLGHPVVSNEEQAAMKYCFKRPASPSDGGPPQTLKRSRASNFPRVISYNEPRCSKKLTSLPRSLSETEASIKRALQKSDEEPDLIGDFTEPYALPRIKGKHDDLKMISPSTLADVLRGEYKAIVDECTVIDCRYPFEYEGGHIKDAINVYSSDDLFKMFLNENSTTTASSKRQVLVFHCEFSSERGPKLSRLLRNQDRQMHRLEYPRLKHPEIYVLEGGYKAFYEKFEDLCTPCGYVPMRHKDHEAELRQYRGQSKLGGSTKGRAASQIRPLVKF